MQEQEITFPVAAPPKRQYTPAQRAAILRARKKRRAERRRNQIIFLVACFLVLVLVVVGIVKGFLLLGAAIGSLGDTDKQEAASSSTASSDATGDMAEPSGGMADLSGQLVYPEINYDLSGYVYNAADPRLILVNANIPLAESYTVETAIADNTTNVQLQTEAATAYRAMASAAYADGVALVLKAGYHAAEAQQDLFDEWEQYYLDEGYSAQQAEELAQSVVAAPYTSEHQTGYGADILSVDYTDADIGFAETPAFAWLKRYAAEYGFVLRYPEAKQMITGRVYEPWHWRYVGVENAKAMVQSGYSLEEFIALDGAVLE